MVATAPANLSKARPKRGKSREKLTAKPPVINIIDEEPVEELVEHVVASARPPQIASPLHCSVSGDGLNLATARHEATFCITANDEQGKPLQNGGEHFHVAIRGGSLVRARVSDHGNGQYTVTFKPSTSGKYSIAITLHGISLPGSPYPLSVFTPAPAADQCELSGEALTSVIARTASNFEVHFRDLRGEIAVAEELDVYVEVAAKRPHAAATSDQAPHDAAEEQHDKKPVVDESSPSTGTVTSVESYVGVRVEVGAKPLVLRKGFETSSENAGQLRPGQCVTVVEERTNTAGDLRARVALLEHEGEESIAASWWNPSAPPPPKLTGTSGTKSSPLKKKKKQKKKTARPAHTSAGWVTLVKAGVPMVRKRLRLEAGQRQQHLLQWARQTAADKMIVGSMGGLDSHGLPRTASKVLVQERSADATEIGFAYGGIWPGTLHAHGQLHESHKCTYSVGKAGNYLLHVWLHNQALPMPGSPFQLVVRPGTPSAQPTSLPAASLPMQGGVGKAVGCRVLLHARDNMGNPCDSASDSAVVSCSCLDQRVQSQCTDNGDGTHSLLWRSDFSGVFQVHITIFGEHILGSPANVRLKAAEPDLRKTEAGGPGAEEAEAGKPSVLLLRFVDKFGNSATPLESLKVGLLVVPEALKKADETAEAVATGDSIEYESAWVEEGLLEVKYVATTAGFNDLHLWCDVASDDDETSNQSRVPLPTSPLKLAVTAGRGNVSSSTMDAVAREVAVDKPGGKYSVRLTPAYLNNPSHLIAGDVAIVRPKVSDKFGNPGMISETALSAMIRLPNGEEQPLSVTPHTRGGLTTYDFRLRTKLSGTHEAHVNLGDKPIPGSPLCFEVEADYHEPAQCYLIPPTEAPLLSETSYLVTLQMVDAFGNKCSRGGDVVAAKLGYIKQGVADSTNLTSDNHSIAVEDMNDGTYALMLSLNLGRSEKAPFPSGATVEVNLDRDSKERPTGIQMPPLPLWFQRNPATESALGAIQRGGRLVVAAGSAIKVMQGKGMAKAPPPAAAPGPAPVPAKLQILAGCSPQKPASQPEGTSATKHPTEHV